MQNFCKIKIGCITFFTLHFNMQNFEKWHFFIQKSKNFFLFFMGDESLWPKIYDQICSICSTADITVIQSSKLSKLRSTFESVPLNFFNCSGWNSFSKGFFWKYEIILNFWFIWYKSCFFFYISGIQWYSTQLKRLHICLRSTVSQ